MKKLITVTDVKKAAEERKSTLYIEPGTIITPAAKDSANELNIRMIEETEHTQQAREISPVISTAWKADVTPELVAKIVKQVMASLPGSMQPEMIKESDPSGLRLVKGNTVIYEKFNTRKPNDKVGIKEILSKRESPHMKTGFMTFEKTNFSRDLEFEEINYIIEGTLEMTLNGRTYHGEAGDVFFLPKDTNVTFSSPDKVAFFFVSLSL